MDSGTRLLDNIVPVDPISRFIHFFSNAHTLPFFLVLAVFFLWFVYRAVRRKQIKLIWLNDIDSGFPILLSLLMAIAATTYNSIPALRARDVGTLLLCPHAQPL